MKVQLAKQFNVFNLPILPSQTTQLCLRLSIMSSPARRVVVYYQSHYNGDKYVSPTPLRPISSLLPSISTTVKIATALRPSLSMMFSLTTLP